MRTQLRQGDVLLIKVRSAAALKSAKPVRPENGRLILARGELSGHAHIVGASRAELFEERQGNLYLRVTRPARLEHEEHTAIALAPGLYAVVRQREYRAGMPVNAGD
jgi:hypothetical protein